MDRVSAGSNRIALEATAEGRTGLKVFNISSSDLKGRRFNGFDAHTPLETRGIQTKFGSLRPGESQEKWVRMLWPGRLHTEAAFKVAALETALGVNGRFQFWTRSITRMPEFQEADLIHLQIVHDHFLTLKTIQKMAELKPVIWTWHDLWPLTGHCITPAGCPRWAEGCGKCPNLLAPLPSLTDRTKSEFKRKHDFIANLNADIHVSTRWMEEHVRKALPAGSRLRLHRFPFGIDTEIYQDTGNQRHIRERLQISPDAFVVTARGTMDHLKGFLPLLVALDRLAKNYDVVLVTVQDSNIAQRYTNSLRVIELPWSSHESELSLFYSLGDIFAMPSLGESFGLMALEAMSCSRPVITTAGTATAEVVGTPNLEVTRNNLVQSTYEVLEWCIQHPEAMKEHGMASRARALTEYSMDKYITNLANLYSSVHERASE